jgi:hypothetical protein
MRCGPAPIVAIAIVKVNRGIVLGSMPRVACGAPADSAASRRVLPTIRRNSTSSPSPTSSSKPASFASSVNPTAFRLSKSIVGLSRSLSSGSSGEHRRYRWASRALSWSARAGNFFAVWATGKLFKESQPSPEANPAGPLMKWQPALFGGSGKFPSQQHNGG